MAPLGSQNNNTTLMSSIHYLLTIYCFLHTPAAWTPPTSTGYWTMGYFATPLGVCMNRNVNGASFSRQYFCNSDNSSVMIASWADLDCNGSPRYLKTYLDHTHSAAYFNCTAPVKYWMGREFGNQSGACAQTNANWEQFPLVVEQCIAAKYENGNAASGQARSIKNCDACSCERVHYESVHVCSCTVCMARADDHKETFSVGCVHGICEVADPDQCSIEKKCPVVNATGTTATPKTTVAATEGTGSTTTTEPNVSFSTQIFSDTGRFIWVGPQTTDFVTANSYCYHQYRTVLASIHSEDENTEITNLCMANAAAQRCYIGLADLDNEGTFEWVDGSDLDYIAPEFEGDNAYHGNGVYEDCVAIMSEGAWADTTCNTYHPYSFICNAPISSPTSDPMTSPTDQPSLSPESTPTVEPTEDFHKTHQAKGCERLKVALTLILHNHTHDNNENEDTFYYTVKGNPSKMTTIIKTNIDSVWDNDSFADQLNIVLIDINNPSLNRVKLDYNITNCNKHIVVDVYLNSSNFTDELTDDINKEYGYNTVADITTNIVHILPPPLNVKDLSFSNPVTWVLLIAFIALVIFFICSVCHNNCCDHLSCFPCFHAVDESKPMDVLLFVLTVGSFFLHCNNIYVLYYYYENKIDSSRIILSSAIILSVIVFLQIIVQPLFAAFYTFKFTKWKQQPTNYEEFPLWGQQATEYEELCNTYWAGRKWAVLFFIMISGSFYVTLQLLNSRVFGVELFWMGMTEPSLKQYAIFQKIGTLLLFISSVIQMLCSVHFHTIGHDKEITGFFIAALAVNVLNSIHQIAVNCSESLEHQHYDIVISVVVEDKEERNTLEQNAGKTKELRRELAMELEVEMDKIQIGKVQRTGTGIKIYAQYICYSASRRTACTCPDIVRHAQIQPQLSFTLSGDKRQHLEETLGKLRQSENDSSRLEEIVRTVYGLNAYPKSVKSNTEIANNIELQPAQTDYRLLHSQ